MHGSTMKGKIERKRKAANCLPLLALPASMRSLLTVSPHSAITAVYRGTPKGGEPAILRSYDSRREPSPEFDCTIWEAGRATSSIGLAFKPIQIGQSVFHDDGAGNFNPAVNALNEAVSEWPGREVGVFVSVGTGKRPKGTDASSSMWYEGFLGEFAEARRKLIAKIEGCERIHELVKNEYLSKRGVNIENYYRLNVEVGVGEFGMNEWNRLAEISTSTRQYLKREDEQRMVQGASGKLAKIHLARLRWARQAVKIPDLIETASSDISSPLAIELPAEIPTSWPAHSTPPSRQSYESGHDSLTLPSADNSSPRSSGERLRPVAMVTHQPQHKAPAQPTAAPPPAPPSSRTSQPRTELATNGKAGQSDDSDRLLVMAPTPAQYRNASGADKIVVSGPDDSPRQPKATLANRQGSAQPPSRVEPPPLPPKTPLQQDGGHRPSPALPYPLDDDDAPPAVNMARKPEYRGR